MIPKEPLRVVVLAAGPQVVEGLQRAFPDAVVTWIDPVSPTQAAALARRSDAHLTVVDFDAIDPALVETWKAMLKGRGPGPPVLGFASRPEALGRAAALAIGMDDVIEAPFTLDRVLVRVAMLTQRGAVVPRGGQAAPSDDLVVDVLHRQARLGGAEMHLTGVEQSLLSLFMAHAGQVLSRELILNEVWGLDYAPDSNVVERHIHSLRHKLQDDWRHPRYIQTVHGKGYRLLSDVARLSRHLPDDPLAVEER